jgi:hypothetical protein
MKFRFFFPKKTEFLFGFLGLHITAQSPSKEMKMASRVQELAARMSMSVGEFVGEMRKLGCSEPTAMKIWRGEYEDFDKFNDNDIYLSNLRKASVVLKVGTGALLPK